MKLMGVQPYRLFTEPKYQVDDTALFDYSLFFVSILYDYYMETKDEETRKDLTPTAYRQIELAVRDMDEEKGFFVSGKGRQISWASQVWMVLADVFGDKARNAQLLEHTIVIDPKIRMVTPYMYHHFIEALVQNDRKEVALSFMRAYWGEMVKDGADTFWELYDPADKNIAPYGSKMVNSYCHAWSCSPSYIIRKYLV